MQTTFTPGAQQLPTGFRIQSSGPITGPLWPRASEREMLVRDRVAAVTLAAKSSTAPGSVIEVVHVASGEVVFRKPGDALRPADGARA
jgi:hypothetical protein